MDKSGNLHVEIISPSGFVFDGFCHMATIPSTNGEIGILVNHEPTIAMLKEGQINIYDSNEQLIKHFDVTGGFANNLENKLLILIDK